MWLEVSENFSSILKKENSNLDIFLEFTVIYNNSNHYYIKYVNKRTVWQSIFHSKPILTRINIINPAKNFNHSYNDLIGSTPPVDL